MYYITEKHTRQTHPEIYRDGVVTLSEAKDLIFAELQAKLKQIKAAGVRTDVKTGDNGTWYYLRYGHALQNSTEYTVMKDIGKRGYVPEEKPDENNFSQESS